MTTTAWHPLVASYRRQLSAESARLPVDQARELVADIDEHLESALPRDASEAEVRNVLERLGTPHELVSASGGETVPAPRPAVSAVPALWCLVLAEFLFYVPPYAVVFWGFGVVFVVRSVVWSRREKLLALLVVGIGFPAAFMVGLSPLTPDSTCYTEHHNGRLVADTCAGVEPTTVVLWVASLTFLAVQAVTIWRLTRSAWRR